MPGFDTIITAPSDTPGAWFPDRYVPAAFDAAGPMFGRTDVLHIGIDELDASTNRPPAYNGAFYNTQGRKYDLYQSGPGVLAADLYIPASWGDSDNGFRRSDMWATLASGDAVAGYVVTGYPIIGFTNQGGDPRYRIWNDAGWVDLATPVTYDAWTSLTIAFDGSIVTYLINGTPVYTATGDFAGSTLFKDTIMQAYNFGQDFGANISPSYDVYWASDTPEPAAFGLAGLGLAGLILFARRRSA